MGCVIGEGDGTCYSCRILGPGEGFVRGRVITQVKVKVKVKVKKELTTTTHEDHPITRGM